jgi:predicted membrane channel-forming protein YqfA (hemolysin III family)
MLGLVWALATLGVFIKATRGAARYKKFAMALYLGMAGWPSFLSGRLRSRFRFP